MTTLFQHRLLCCIAGSFLFLGGCAMEPSSSHQSVPTDDIQSPSQNTRYTIPAATQSPASTPLPATQAETEIPPQPISNPAAANLLGEAAQARAQGDYARAQTLAERAQTIAPQEARAYLELSRIYAQRGDTAHARQMAVRGLSVVRDDPTTERDLQQMSTP